MTGLKLPDVIIEEVFPCLEILCIYEGKMGGQRLESDTLYYKLSFHKKKELLKCI